MKKYEFVVDGITNGQAEMLLDMIIDAVENMGGEMAGGIVEVDDGQAEEG